MDKSVVLHFCNKITVLRKHPIKLPAELATILHSIPLLLERITDKLVIQALIFGRYLLKI